MKILTICTGWISQQQWITDDAKADAAYETIKAAMDSYSPFGNDKQKTITVDTGTGAATYRLESLFTLSIDSCEAGEETLIEKEIWKRQLEAKIAARVAPAATIDPS